MSSCWKALCALGQLTGLLSGIVCAIRLLSVMMACIVVFGVARGSGASEIFGSVYCNAKATQLSFNPKLDPEVTSEILVTCHNENETPTMVDISISGKHNLELRAIESGEKIRVLITPENVDGSHPQTFTEYWEIKDIVKLAPTGSEQFFYTIRGHFDDRVQVVPGSYSGALAIRLEYNLQSP